MKIKVVIYLLLIIFVSSCTENFEDFNTDKKNPAEVPGEALFTNALKTLADQMNTPDVNRNVWELWCQYWTETTYTDEANYDITRGQSEQVFRYFYRDVLRDLDEAAKLISEAETANAEEEAAKANKLVIIEVLNIFSYQRMVDIFGAIPYSEAMDIGNVYPNYEMGDAVYDDLLVRLDAAISALNVSAGSFGSEDLIYGGDVAAWKMFANSLKVKMGINLADVNSAKAKSTVESAVQSGVFQANEDDALLPYASSAPNYNEIYANLVASGRNDFVAANTLIDIMVNRNDPRLNDYFNEETVRPFPYPRDPATGAKVDVEFAEGENTILFIPDGAGGFTPTFTEGPFTVFAADSMSGVRVWLGGTYGASAPWSVHSQVNDDILEPTFPGIIMTYSEILFYLAEAAERGYSVGGTAEEFYNAGVTASILWWGGTQTDADDYLANPDVAYATAEGTWQRKIAYQSWIASYINGFVGYTTWRRLDYPVLNITPTNPDIVAVTDIPTRFIFPINEQTLNEVAYAAAASAIGGDELTTKVFWDLHDANGE